MGFSWDFNGIFMGISLDSNGIFMGFSWDFHDFNRIFMILI